MQSIEVRIKKLFNSIYPGRYVNKLKIEKTKKEITLVGPAYTKYVGKFIKAGHLIPVKPLKLWVERKLNIEKNKSLSVAFAIRTKIFQQGSKLPFAPYKSDTGVLADHTEKVETIIKDEYLKEVEDKFF